MNRKCWKRWAAQPGWPASCRWAGVAEAQAPGRACCWLRMLWSAWLATSQAWCPLSCCNPRLHPQDNPKALPLKLRPRDKHCHATYGVREPSRRLLLRLTRPEGGDSGEGGNAAGAAWTAQVVAALPYSYRFTQPADFQYVGIDSRPVEEQGEHAAWGRTQGRPRCRQAHHVCRSFGKPLPACVPRSRRPNPPLLECYNAMLLW